MRAWLRRPAVTPRRRGGAGVDEPFDGQTSDAKLLDALRVVSGDLNATVAREAAHYSELSAGISAQNDKEVGARRRPRM